MTESGVCSIIYPFFFRESSRSKLIDKDGQFSRAPMSEFGEWRFLTRTFLEHSTITTTWLEQRERRTIVRME
jgi:hypothetical protein